MWMQRLVQGHMGCKPCSRMKNQAFWLWSSNSPLFFKDLFIYSWETQTEGEAGSLQGARCGTRSQDPGIMPWAKGRRSTTEPPKCPNTHLFNTHPVNIALGEDWGQTCTWKGYTGVSRMNKGTKEWISEIVSRKAQGSGAWRKRTDFFQLLPIPPEFWVFFVVCLFYFF